MKTSHILLLTIGLLVSLSSCNKDDDDPVTTTPPVTTTNPPLPSAISGVTANMEFTTENTGAPYSLNDLVDFTFSTSGEMAIDQDPAANNGNEITIATFTIVGTEYQWEDATNGHRYTLSLQPDSTVNEINVNDLNGAFLGQFTPVGAGGSSELALVQGLEGTYTVASVAKGDHSRMTVVFAANGDIDFDTDVQFVHTDYALISDRLDVLDGIWIDLAPYPSEPYPRLQLFMVSGTQTLESIIYYPEYPNIAGQVEISVD